MKGPERAYSLRAIGARLRGRFCPSRRLNPLINASRGPALNADKLENQASTSASSGLLPEFAISWRQYFKDNLAVTLALLTQGVNFLSGITILILMVLCMSPEEQGFYYTFGGLASIQMILDFDLHLVLLFVASHEWSKLKLGDSGGIGGDPEAMSRLVSLGRNALVWYSWAAALSMVLIGPLGVALMSREVHPLISWRSPWIVLVISTGLFVWGRVPIALLEGCNQVVGANKYRFYESMARAAAICCALALGYGLWAAPAGTIISLAVTYLFLRISYGTFLSPFMNPPRFSKIDWKKEVWPVQWRIGLSGAGASVVMYSMGPILFYCCGSVVAGQTGMTLAMITALQNAATAWMIPKRPLFGVLAARGEYRKLNETWLRFFIASLAMLCLGAAASWLLVCSFGYLRLPVSERFLPPFETLLLLAWCILRHASFCISTYLRAHKRDPIVAVTLAYSLASVSTMVFLSRHYGVLGASMGLVTLASVSLAVELRVWKICRRRWHGNAWA